MATVKVDMTLNRGDKIYFALVSATKITLALGQSGFLTISPRQAKRLRQVLDSCITKANNLKPAAHDEFQLGPGVIDG